MSHVVIVESPAKCKTILKYLGSDYQVLATVGHIRDLPSKSKMVDPEDDFRMHYQLSGEGRSKEAVSRIVEAVRGADSLILATDPDREGEAISWHVLEVLDQKKARRDDLPVRRVVFNSITKAAILKALQQPRDLDMDLVNAQQARRALDYLVGFSLSPVLWTKLPGAKSAGRVQSVALRLISDREREIETFLTQEYWTIHARFTRQPPEEPAPFPARLTHHEGQKLDKFAITQGEQATAILEPIRGDRYRVSSLERKQVRSHPAPPFITSTLQQEASRKLGLTAKRTMALAQGLYEAGWITYMRTDGVEVAPEAVEAARRLIGDQFGSGYLPDRPRVYQSKAANAQEAHEAIRPTEMPRDPRIAADQLEADQAKLYTLIWKRMVASQMASAIDDRVTAEITGEELHAVFRATGSTRIFDGYLKLYHEGRDEPETEAETGQLPPLTEGMAVDLTGIQGEQHFTEPPPRFTEASLVKALEQRGIGRPSTYASILSLLQDRNYVRLEQKRFHPEPRGRVVTAFLTQFFAKYVEFDFTAKLETDLDRVSDGKLPWKQLLHAFWADFQTAIQQAEPLKVAEVLDSLNLQLESLLFPGEGTLEDRRRCPSCSLGTLSLKVSARSASGAFIGCSGYPDCKYTRELGPAAAEESVEPADLGQDEQGNTIKLCKGPYGYYVQRGEAAEGAKPPRSSLPKDRDPATVDLRVALDLLALPRELGTHPESGKLIIAGIGRFGPYVKHEKIFASLKKEDDVLTIDLPRALDLIAEKAAGGGRGRAAAPIRVLGTHPDGGEIGIYDGRYGPYVKHGKINATLPKDREADQIQLDEAVALIAAKAATKKPARTKTTKAAKTTKTKKTTKTAKATKKG